MNFDSFIGWAAEKIIALLIANPATGVFVLGILGILGTFTAFATIFFQGAHKIAMLTATDKDDQFVTKAEYAWGKLIHGPFGFLFKSFVKYAYFTPPKL